MTTPETQNVIATALSQSRGLDTIDAIKGAVAREFEALDPSATIKATDYFNHSYVPDLVVSWSDGGKLQERPVFLRFTLRAALLGRDVPALSAVGPILLTLKEDRQDVEIREQVRVEAQESPRLLVTEIPALTTVASAGRQAGGRPTSPLLELLKPNIVRGARGILDAVTVQDLTESAAPPADITTPGGAAALLARFDEIVGTVFVEDAAFRLRRSAEILRIGLSENADELLADSDESAFAGRLSSAELTTLIPYLLSRSDVTQSSAFWAQVGSLMDLERLTEMAKHLDGLDLTPLISANLDSWDASWAYLSGVAEGEALPESSDVAGWRMRAGWLCLAVSNWEVQLSPNGRRFRGRSKDGQSARWIDLQPALGEFDVIRITLRGASRTVEIGTADEGDIRNDVAAVSDSIPEDFFVPVASIRDRRDRQPSVIATDFPRMLANGNKGTTIRQIAKAALRVLAHRYPPAESEYARFVGYEVGSGSESRPVEAGPDGDSTQGGG